MTTGYLFYTKGKLSDFLEGRKEKIKKDVLNLPKGEIEKNDPSDISEAIVQKYILSVPTLNKDQLRKIIEKDIQIKIKEPVPYETFRLSKGPREKILSVDGKEAIVEIPFTGDSQLFDYQPIKHILTIPKGDIIGNHLRLRLVYKKTEDIPFDLRIQHQLERIEFYLRGVFDEVDVYNRSLSDYTLELINKRRAKNQEAKDDKR